MRHYIFPSQASARGEAEEGVAMRAVLAEFEMSRSFVLSEQQPFLFVGQNRLEVQPVLQETSKPRPSKTEGAAPAKDKRLLRC
jgi:hypothetical protein